MSTVQGLNIADLATRNASIRPDAEAVVCGTHRATYRELEDRARRLAAELTARGVRPGDRVVWLGKNCHIVLETLLACARVGAMFCPLNWRSRTEEIVFCLRDLQPTVAIYDDRAFEATAIGALQDRLDHPVSWLERARYESALDGQVALADRACEFAESDPVLVLYTSAFGGTASGSMLTHQNLLVQSLLWLGLWEFDEHSVYLACGPLFHVAVWISIIPTLQVGGRIVISEQSDAETICRLIERERCTNGLVLPQTIEKIIELNADGRYDLKSFRSFIERDGWNDMVVRDDSRMGRSPGGYGQTEVTGSATISALGPRPEDLTSGVASPAALVRVVDEEDSEAKIGDIGEIIVRGPIVHAGYWNRPEANRVRNRGGWWHTGDLGRLEVDGSVSFVGPKQRMIKSGMENIYPVEVELCIEAHDRVKEAAVIGIPDDRWVQAVRAVVVRQPGQSLSEEEVIEWCRSRLASYKKPRSVVFVDSIPRVGYAKDYDALDSEHGGGNYPGAGTAYIATSGT